MSPFFHCCAAVFGRFSLNPWKKIMFVDLGNVHVVGYYAYGRLALPYGRFARLSYCKVFCARPLSVSLKFEEDQISGC